MGDAHRWRMYPLRGILIRNLNFRTLKGFNTSAQGIALRENEIATANLNITIFFYLYGH